MKIFYKSVFLILITIISAILVTNIGKKMMSTNYEFSYNPSTYYSSYQQNLSVKDYQNAPIVIEIIPNGKRFKFEKNIILEATIINTYKGSCDSNLIRIIEPVMNGNIFLNDYLPMKKDESYILFIEESHDFEFSSYKLYDTPLYYYKTSPSFSNGPADGCLLKELDKYDYLDYQQTTYHQLQDFIDTISTANY